MFLIWYFIACKNETEKINWSNISTLSYQNRSFEVVCYFMISFNNDSMMTLYSGLPYPLFAYQTRWNRCAVSGLTLLISAKKICFTLLACYTRWFISSVLKPWIFETHCYCSHILLFTIMWCFTYTVYRKVVLYSRAAKWWITPY